MTALQLDALPSDIKTRFAPFGSEVLARCPDCLVSLAVTGSAVTPDFDASTSDINSIMILKDASFDFIRFLAPLGKNYRQHKIAVPLVMTRDYIESSLDVFPIEFLDLKLIHTTVYGADLLGALAVDPRNLRLQCEREIKTRLLALSQGYIAHLGEAGATASLLVRLVKNSFPLMRAILTILGKQPPVPRDAVIAQIEQSMPLERGVFSRIISLRHAGTAPDTEAVNTVSEQLYRTLEILSRHVDALPNASA
ncbi:MAG TPA: hypothetical protein VK445_05370 [Dissulfurispiraceae bacterium]|nr:hypothetical protein [Dissulfurispiraceae bacterium]